MLDVSVRVNIKLFGFKFIESILQILNIQSLTLMNSSFVQERSFRKRSSKNNPKNQPKTNTSLNIFSQMSVNKNSHSEQQYNNYQLIELTNNVKTTKNKNRSYTSIQSSPMINPFSIQSQGKQPDNIQLQSQTQENSPSTAKFKEKKEQTVIQDVSTGWGHSLIKFIVQRSTNRTIQHQINIIPKNIILHKKCPQDTTNDAVKQTQVALVAGKKLNQLYSKIRNEFKNLQIIKQKSQHNNMSKTNNMKNRVKSSNCLIVDHQKDSKQKLGGSIKSTKSLVTLTKSNSFSQKRNRLKTQPNNKMIIPSGLVSYRFKSLKAQKSLIYDPLNNKSSQQLLQTQLKTIKQRLNCSTHRAHKIQYRSVSKKLKETKHKQIAFRQGLVKQELKDMTTSQYLKSVVKEKNKIDKVYGEEGSRLQYISYLMNQLSLDRPLAQQSVDQIDCLVRQQIGAGNTQENPEKSQQKQQDNSEENEDNRVLSSRKRVIYKPKRTHKKLHQPKLIQQQYTHRSGVILNSLTFLNEY